MTKRTTLIFLYLCIGLVVNAQQELLDEPIDLLQEKDVFFNQKLINPTFLTDSNKIFVDYVTYHKSLDNTFNDGNSFSGEGCISSNSIGLNIDFRRYWFYKHRSLTASFKHKFPLKNKSVLDIGLNLGLMQYDYELWHSNSFTGIETTVPDWIEIPLINLGLAYKYRNHSFALSYDMLSTTVSSGFSERDLKKAGLIASYQGYFKVSNRFMLIPELYGCFHSDEMYGIVAVKFEYFNKLSGGILYNTKESIACQLSVIILKRIKLGYSIGSYKSSTINLYSLNLGLII